MRPDGIECWVVVRWRGWHEYDEAVDVIAAFTSQSAAEEYAREKEAPNRAMKAWDKLHPMPQYPVGAENSKDTKAYESRLKAWERDLALEEARVGAYPQPCRFHVQQVPPQDA